MGATRFIRTAWKSTAGLLAVILSCACAAVTGDRVVLNGYYRAAPKFKDGALQPGKDVYFEVNSIERGETAYGDVKWSEAEEKQIKELVFLHF